MTELSLNIIFGFFFSLLDMYIKILKVKSFLDRIEDRVVFLIDFSNFINLLMFVIGILGKLYVII